MQEKKESSFINIFIYLLIFILIILAIAPPLTRVFFKENNTNAEVDSNNSVTATALTCRKEVTVGTMIYNITITSNYSNDTLNKVTFTYEQPEVIDNTITDNPVLTEINNLRNTGLFDETNDGLTTIFVLTKGVKEENLQDANLDGYFQTLDSQKANLESLGYKCSSLTV